MATLADLCPVQQIVLDAPLTDRDALLAYCANLAAPATGVRASVLLQQLQDRERIGPTSLGRGVAIPHARIAGLAAPYLLFVRTLQAIDCDAPDGKAVQDFFVLLMPAKTVQLHLQVLADLVSALHDRYFRQALHAATSAPGINLLLGSMPVRTLAQRQQQEARA